MEMNEGEFRDFIQKQPIFNIANLFQYYPNEEEASVKVQLSRFINKKLIFQIRQGLYISSGYAPSSNLLLAQKIYDPSYISFETALNYYGIIPDIPISVTSATTNKTKEFSNNFGNFTYRSIKPELFFGFSSIVEDQKYGYGYKIASAEKSLLDYFYINKNIETIEELRLRTDIEFSKDKLIEYSTKFPDRVRKLLREYLKLRHE